MHVNFKTLSALKHSYKPFCGPHRADICTRLSSDHRVLEPQLKHAGVLGVVEAATDHRGLKLARNSPEHC